MGRSSHLGSQYHLAEQLRLDGIKAAGVDLSALNFLPLFELGLAWLLPTLAAIVVSLLWRVPEQAAVAAE